MSIMVAQWVNTTFTCPYIDRDCSKHRGVLEGFRRFSDRAGDGAFPVLDLLRVAERRACLSESEAGVPSGWYHRRRRHRRRIASQVFISAPFVAICLVICTSVPIRQKNGNGNALCSRLPVRCCLPVNVYLHLDRQAQQVHWYVYMYVWRKRLEFAAEEDRV